MFFNVGGLEVLVIAMVALIVVGPEQLPGLMRKIGKYARQARSMSSALRDEFMSGIEEVQDIANPESWMGKGTADDPIVPEGFADKVNADSKNGSSASSSKDGDGATDLETDAVTSSDVDSTATDSTVSDASETNSTDTDSTATDSRVSDSRVSDASETDPAAPKPKISKIAQANSSHAVVEAAAEAERVADAVPAEIDEISAEPAAESGVHDEVLPENNTENNTENNGVQDGAGAARTDEHLIADETAGGGAS